MTPDTGDRVDRPHVEFEDGSKVELRLNGERMHFRDGHDDGFTADADFEDGRIVANLAEGGVGVEVLDEDELKTRGLFNCELKQKTESRMVFVPPETVSYSFEIEVVREVPA